VGETSSKLQYVGLEWYFVSCTYSPVMQFICSDSGSCSTNSVPRVSRNVVTCKLEERLTMDYGNRLQRC
jgi:hypothetical protein